MTNLINKAGAGFWILAIVISIYVLFAIIYFSVRLFILIWCRISPKFRDRYTKWSNKNRNIQEYQEFIEQIRETKGSKQ